jgi:putative NADPH-quinone reductase
MVVRFRLYKYFTTSHTKIVNKAIKNVLVILADSTFGDQQFSIARQACNEYCGAALEKQFSIEFVDLLKDYKTKKFDPILFEKETNLEQYIDYRIRIKNADQIVFFYQTVWGTMPSIMKGFLETVMIEGFAFSKNGSLTHPEPHLDTKKAEVFVFEDNGWSQLKLINSNFEQNFWQRSVFKKTGIKGRVSFYYDIKKMNMERFEGLKIEIRNYVQKLFISSQKENKEMI